jgi:hypothetical protein
VIPYRLASRQPQVKISILDAAGDTIQVLNGPGAVGINRVAWAFAGKPASRPPLGAVQKRDSALQMNRITFVLDSLDKSGANPMMTGMMRQLVRSGDFTPLTAMFQGRGGGSGFGAPPGWNARPGEQAIAGGGRGAGAPSVPGGAVAPAGNPTGSPTPAAAAPAGPPAALDPSAFQTLIPLFTIPGRASSGGGFGLDFMQTLGFGNAALAAFGGGGAAGVATGDYVAVMTVGGKTLRQKVRVERGNA